MVVYLCISFVPLIFFFNTIMISIRDYFQTDREKKLLNAVNIIAPTITKANYFSHLGDESKRQMMDSDIADFSAQGSYRILVLDNYGMVLNDSNNAEVGRTKIIPEVINALERENAIKTHTAEQTVYAAAPIENEASEIVGAVLVVSSIEDIFVSVSEIEQKLIMYTAITTIVMGVLGFAVPQVLIDPLSSIVSVVQKMSDGHLDQRIKISGRDEYAKLGHAFNDMAEKLEKVDNTRQEFVSNVSHELKTPLSSIKVLSESILLQNDAPLLMYREFLRDINSEVDRMTRVVTDLLQLVKLDQGELGLNIQTTNINRMVSDILKRLGPLAERKEIKLIFEDVREVVIEADEMKITSTISNLLDNAVKYTPNGGTVKTTVDADHQNAFITVSDTGIGIKEEDQGKIFDRFYRVDKTRDRETGGTGLGLAITYSTVRLHHGSIRVISKENEGSLFIVRLPIHYSRNA
ncbi:MAG: cell wall metabolism sensor histidine kinase WalK [Clostridiales bacterium]|jgi:signal transduction histidine kinase|nr:cell wall metabolism sensor histidine kinase WalK [Clostridiales bacterium]